MKISLLLMVPFLAMATAGVSQPQTMEQYLEDGYYINSSANVNGSLFFSEYYTLVKFNQDEWTNHLKNVGGKAINFREVNGILYFTVYRDDLDESTLWRSDGSTGGTQPVAIFSNTYSHISPVVNIGNTVYFGFEDKLYKTDGTAAGTIVVKDLDVTNEYGFVRLLVVGNTIYVNLRKSNDHYELWKSDGTHAGTVLYETFRFIELLPATKYIGYFVADDGVTGRELWKVTPSSFSLVSDIEPGNGNSFSDGTVAASAGEVMVFATTSPSNIWSIHNSPIKLASLSASEIVHAGESFYFISEDEVWKTNGTVAGTVMLKKFPTGARVSNLVAHDKTAFFVVDGKQLWQSDGSPEGTVMIKHHSPDPQTSGGITPVSVGDVLYYFWALSVPEQPNAVEILMYHPDDVWIPSIQLVNAGNDEDIRTLNGDDVILASDNISIRADASLGTERVTFHINGALFRTENARPFSLAGDNNGNYNEWNPSPGSYQIRVTPFDGEGTAGGAATYNITVVDADQGCATGTILREYWTNIPGNTVAAIPVTRRPTGTGALTSFEGPLNAGKNYAARIKGYVCPPATGNYTFWISSNDHSELWLSSGDDPRKKEKIASVSGATGIHEWGKFRSQKSALIHLEAGQRYYIEALHKQGDGTDHVAVGWQLPDGEMERPIPGSRLSPFTGNSPPMVRIVTPVDGQIFDSPATVEILAEGEDYDGFISKYELFTGDRLVEEWNNRATLSNLLAGTYIITARATDDDGAVTTSDPVTIIVRGACAASGTITREYWSGVQGNRVSEIPVNRAATGEQQLSLFEAPQNAGTNYGARIRGFICPPASGEYVFWIASNDHSELWLSADDDPATKRRIAYVTGSTSSRQWNKFGSQRSTSIMLEHGKKYYIEALHKQGVGTDNLAVGWQLPDGTMERPVSGSRLSPYGESSQPGVRVISPADGSTDIDPLVMKLTIQPVESASRYTVEVSTTADFSGPSMIINSVEDHQIAFVLKDLQHATTYYTRVKTNISGFGPVSEFTTREVIPQQRLWGLTTEGGKDGVGTIFSFSIDSSHFVKHYDKEVVRFGEGEDEFYDERFIGSPIAGPDGTLYGQADHSYSGDLFEMDKDGNVRWLQAYLFVQEGNIMLGSDNSIYVTTRDYLIGGTISKYPIDYPDMSRPLRNSEPRVYGRNPEARLLELHDGFLYGAAFDGGLNNAGTLYRIRGSGADFEVIHYFDKSIDGMNPRSGLIEAGGYLYGSTAHGGSVNNAGTIFRMRPDGSEFAKLHDFDGIGGRNPFGELILMNDVLYGMTTEGGTSDLGVVYRINQDGSGFMKLHEFSGMNGAIPSGALTHDRDGNLYGMTSEGGANNLGVIFKIHSVGTGFSKLFDFSASSGGGPTGSLVIREDTFPQPMTAMAMQGSESVFSISIHPNPSTDNFQVNVQTPGREKTQLVITDQYGNIVSSHEIENDIPTEVGAELKKGLYIMKIIQGSQIAMKRVVKK